MYFKKYSATNMIRDLSIELDKRNNKVADAKTEETSSKLKSIITDIISNTSDERLRSAFSDYVSP